MGLASCQASGEKHGGRSAPAPGVRERHGNGYAEGMKHATLLALDMGTSSVRAMLFDVKGRALPGAEAQTAYAQRTTSDGGVEADAETLLATTVDCLRQLLRQADKTATGEPRRGRHFLLLALAGRGGGGQSRRHPRPLLGRRAAPRRRPSGCADTSDPAAVPRPDRLRTAPVVLARQIVLAARDAGRSLRESAALDVLRRVRRPAPLRRGPVQPFDGLRHGAFRSERRRLGRGDAEASADQLPTN